MNRILVILSAVCLAQVSSAKTFKIDGKSVQTGQDFFKIDGKTYNHSGAIRLKQSATLGKASGPAAAATFEKQLYVVQFATQILPAYHNKLKDMGLKVYKYVPDHALLVKADQKQMQALESLDYVRQVQTYDGSFKTFSVSDAARFAPAPFDKTRYDLVPTDKTEVSELLGRLQAKGIEVVHNGQNSFAVTIMADVNQVDSVSNFPEILHIEKAPDRVESDMDMALIQGGAQALTLSTGSYKGEGIRGHVLEGIYADHQDFTASEFRKAPIAVEDGSPDTHGQATYGIIFGDGTGDETALGLMPRAQGFYTNRTYVFNNDNRYQLTKDLIDNHQVMLQTASWGYPRNYEYNARSLEMDKIIFELDIPVTQSQSNSGTRHSRPQAWAKNIISVGGIYHNNDSDPSNDRWGRGASIGPAQDGRIKPEIVSFYDDIHTTYSSSITGYGTFGGTSGATPIVNGHLGLIIEMFTDGIFGNTLQYPVEERFLNRPHAATAKALLLNSARQYTFQGEDHDLTRVHQGWGHPSLDNLYDMRDNILIVDESDVIQTLETKTYEVEVSDSTPQLTMTMVYNDPPGVVGATVDRVNDLDLKVTSPDGTVYWGNYGLLANMFSLPDGERDAINTVETVIVDQPMTGKWTVEVTATEINQDGHIETSDVDADYALVVSGITR